MAPRGDELTDEGAGDAVILQHCVAQLARDEEVARGAVMPPSPEQPAGLIAVLLDADAPFGDRDDAAMDLGGYDEPEAEVALTTIVVDAAEDEELIDTAGESLWQIWNRQGKFDAALVARMHPAARKFFAP